MLNTLWLPAAVYTSQYDLINAFVDQLTRGAHSIGLPVNAQPDGAFDASLRPAALFFNYSPDFPDRARARAEGRCAQPAILHWLIDHPLTLSEEVWRTLERTPGYRLLTVSDDDGQLLSLHYPGIRRARCWHGVDPEALCDADAISASHRPGGARDIDVLITGTVLSDDQLSAMRLALPAPLRPVCDDMVALCLTHPLMAFTQAWDLCAPNGLHSATHWDLLRAAFGYSTAAVNTSRRLALLRALDGLRVTVIGSGPWASAGVRGLTVVPPVPYSRLPEWFARSRISLAVNPTQFVHGFSERLLLALAGGCAALTDDRLWVRREFGAQSPDGACVRTFPVEHPGACREAVESLLSDRDACAALGAAGRSAAAARHLWRHRLQTIAVVADGALTELGAAPAQAHAAL